MSRTSSLVVASLIAVVGVSHQSAATYGVDSVVRRNDGVTIRGELTALTTSEVTITQSNGQAQNISVANLRDVRFDKEPTGLLSARSAERSGALDNALKGYQDAAGAYTGDDKRLTTDLEFLIARVQAKQALTDPGKLDAAIAGLKSFREANKTNFRYLEATLVQAELHAAKQDVDAGKALLTEVQASPVRGFQLQAGVQLGRLLLASNSLPEALTAFDLVIQQSAGDDSAQAAMYDGKLGRALCLRQQGNTDDAIATLDEVIASAAASESRILAEAWVRKGDCLKQKNETKAALMAYLHVDVLYPGEPAQHAESLLRLSQLWAAVGYPDRAQDAAARLTERYPNSQWTSQIGQEG